MSKNVYVYDFQKDVKGKFKNVDLKNKKLVWLSGERSYTRYDTGIPPPP